MADRTSDNGGGCQRALIVCSDWLNKAVTYVLWICVTAKERCAAAFRCCHCHGRFSAYAELYGRLLSQNRLATLAYCCAYWGFGMCVGSLGAVMLDFTCLLSSTVSAVSWAFFAQTFSTMVGSAAVGLLSKWLAADFLLLVASILLPVAILALSFSKTFALATAMLAIVGLASGVIDCLANLQMVNLYEKAVSPFLQAMYFAYGLGALLSPLIAQPFLLNEDCTPYVENGTAVPSSFLETSRLSHSFWIMAALQVPVAGLVFILVARGGFRIKAVSSKFQRLINAESVSSVITSGPAAAKGKNHPLEAWEKYMSDFKASFVIKTWRNVVITLSIVTIVFLFDGLQGNFSQYIDSYSLKEAEDFTKSDGAYINMVFWTAFTVGRLLAVIVAIKFTPFFMLILNIIGSTFSLSLLISLPARRASLYVGTTLFGLFCSSVTPTTICMAEQFMDVTTLHMTLVVVAASAGEMLIPLIQGQIFETNTRSFLVMAVTSAAISWFVYAAFWLTGKDTDKYRSINPESFVFMNKRGKCDETAHLAANGIGVAYGDVGEVLNLQSFSPAHVEQAPSWQRCDSTRQSDGSSSAASTP